MNTKELEKLVIKIARDVEPELNKMVERIVIRLAKNFELLQRGKRKSGWSTSDEFEDEFMLAWGRLKSLFDLDWLFVKHHALIGIKELNKNKAKKK